MLSEKLLKTLPDCEFPAEYLVARLLGRKGRLFQNWEFLLAGGDRLESLQNTVFYPYLKKYAAPGVWRFLRSEHLWVRRRMNPNLRRIFGPYFLYHEINTLLICLRYLEKKKDVEAVRQELRDSLLNDAIRKILTGGQDFIRVLRELEIHLYRSNRAFDGLAAGYEKNGLAGLEKFLRNNFLQLITADKPPALLKTFLRYLVDFHNCLSLAKSIRWQTATTPAKISGGTIPDRLYHKAFFNRDLLPVLKFLRLDQADEAAGDPQKLETVLLKHISRRLKRWSHQRTAAGVILYYLWEQYRYSRNISLILNTMLLDEQTVREKIVA